MTERQWDTALNGHPVLLEAGIDYLFQDRLLAELQHQATLRSRLVRWKGHPKGIIIQAHATVRRSYGAEEWRANAWK